MTSVGIDSGSVAVKGVAMDGEELLSVQIEPAGTDIAAQCSRMTSRLKDVLPTECHTPVCFTGYGRENSGEAAYSVSEILANALGAGWAWRNWSRMKEMGEQFYGNPEPVRKTDKFNTIIDVGGQDCKVITLGAGGVIEGFAMNDRCAAGTGRFLGELAAVLQLKGLRRLDELALGSSEPALISSACTVFAESEVVSMIAKGVSPANIAGGVFRAVADRTAELAESLGWCGPVFFDGGPARLGALRDSLQARLATTVSVPACPQHITAVGAAIYARNRRDLSV